MLEMTGISKRFDAVTALNKASLQVNAGEIMALLGSNGSGKSTLVKVLSGLVNPNEGAIKIDGKAVGISSCAAARKLGVAVAYQDLSLIPAMSVVDNIVMNIEPTSRVGTIDRRKAREKAVKYLQRLHIDVDPDMLVQFLMPSTQSMVEIAKAMAMEPRILVLDEATASLHSDEVDVLFKVLKEMKEEGMAIIIVTHRMSEIFRICDRCTILKGGETVACAPVNEMDLDEIVFHMTGKRPDHSAGAEKTHHKLGDEEPILNVRGLNISGKLHGIDFAARRGEVVGIGGLDGQGQAEFIRAILADRKYSSGTICFKGREIHYRTTANAIADNMGFISGDRARESIFPIRSVAENIYAAKCTKGGIFAPLSPKEVESFAQKAMDDYGIVAGSTKHPANSLSGGNQQKLVVGRWIALSPDLLLLDDPTKGVDIHSRQEIHAILRKCLDEGMSIIYVSSDNEELLDISDRIYVFYEGRISAELAGDDRTEEKLVAAMLGIAEGEREEAAK